VQESCITYASETQASCYAFYRQSQHYLHLRYEMLAYSTGVLMAVEHKARSSTSIGELTNVSFKENYTEKQSV